MIASRIETAQMISFVDEEVRQLVIHACARIENELVLSAPFLGELVCGWMSALSPTGKAADYFLQPGSFPLLYLPCWAARSFTVEPYAAFLSDVVYSTINGYYYIRLLDNLMDNHAT